MKDIVTPVPPEEVRSMIKKSLETAALVNYTKLSGEAKIEGKQHDFLLFFCISFAQITNLPCIFSIIHFYRGSTRRRDGATGKKAGRPHSLSGIVC